MDLILVGLNHRTAPVELREKLAFSEEEATRFLADMTREGTAEEGLLISTCNRTELYARVPANGADPEHRAASLRERLIRDRAPGLQPNHFYVQSGLDAARYLFRVSAGLDSMIVGEAQILAQVKEAYRIACEAETNGYLVNRLSHAAFRVGGRARSETEIGVGAVSISNAAVELSQKIFQDLSKKRALVVGAGEMAALTAEHFASKKVGKLAVINRTHEKARALAEKLGGAAEPWDRLIPAIAEADIIIVSTKAPGFIITPDIMRTAMHTRRNSPVFLIDIAVPRNVDPAVGKLYNVFSHNIDDLKHIVDRNLARRRAEATRVERIIDEEAVIFRNWHGSLGVGPTIKALFDRADDIRREELERNRAHFTPEQLRRIDAITQGAMKKLLHAPITKMKEFDENAGMALKRVSLVRELFDLDDK